MGPTNHSSIFNSQVVVVTRTVFILQFVFARICLFIKSHTWQFSPFKFISAVLCTLKETVYLLLSTTVYERAIQRF